MRVSVLLALALALVAPATSKGGRGKAAGASKGDLRRRKGGEQLATGGAATQFSADQIVARDSVNTRYTRGMQHIEDGQFATALALFDGLYADGYSPAGPYGRGLALAGMGREEEALAAYDAAIKKTPVHQGAIFNKAVLLGRKMKRFAEAVALLDHVLTLPKGRAPFQLADAHNELCFALFEDAKAQDSSTAALRALTSCDEAIAVEEIPTKQHISYVTKAAILRHLGREDDAAAADTQAATHEDEL